MGKRKRHDMTAELVEALRFYADKTNYTNPTVSEARRQLGGMDPTVSIQGQESGHHVAPPGCALAPIQFDNYGERARMALRNGGVEG